MPAKTEKQARFMRAVAHGWKPRGKKTPSKKVAREFMTVEQSNTPDPTAWRRGIITKTPDRSTIYFTGKKTKADLKTEEKQGFWGPAFMTVEKIEHLIGTPKTGSTSAPSRALRPFDVLSKLKTWRDAASEKAATIAKNVRGWRRIPGVSDPEGTEKRSQESSVKRAARRAEESGEEDFQPDYKDPFENSTIYTEPMSNKKTLSEQSPLAPRKRYSGQADRLRGMGARGTSRADRGRAFGGATARTHTTTLSQRKGERNIERPGTLRSWKVYNGDSLHEKSPSFRIISLGFLEKKRKAKRKNKRKRMLGKKRERLRET